MSSNQRPLEDDEESYYSEEEVTVTDENDDDFEFKELEKEIYGRMGGTPPDVLAAMGKKNVPTESKVGKGKTNITKLGLRVGNKFAFIKNKKIEYLEKESTKIAEESFQSK